MSHPFRCPECGSKRIRYRQVRVFTQWNAVVGANQHDEPIIGRVVETHKKYHDHAEGIDQLECIACDFTSTAYPIGDEPSWLPNASSSNLERVI